MSEESNKITLNSCEGESFLVDEAVAREFEIIAHMIEDGCVGRPIPLSNVKTMALAKAIEYSKKHVEAGAVEAGAGEAGAVEETEETKAANLKKWDEEFTSSLDSDMLFELLLAANYLTNKGLLDLLCDKVADNIKDMKVEDVRKLFHIENDYTPEEEEAVRKANDWAFE